MHLFLNQKSPNFPNSGRKISGLSMLPLRSNYVKPRPVLYLDRSWTLRTLTKKLARHMRFQMEHTMFDLLFVFKTEPISLVNVSTMFQLFLEFSRFSALMFLVVSILPAFRAHTNLACSPPRTTFPIRGFQNVA